MSSNTNYPLLESVDALEEKNHHSMVLYDDPQYGTAVTNRFIENGLKKGENVILFTHDDINSLEKEVASTGLDVDYYKQKNQLHLYHIENILDKDCSLQTAFGNLLLQLTADAKPPYRFVGRCIEDVSNIHGMEAELLIEKLFHSTFGKHNCSFLCTYSVKDIEKTKRSLWLHHLLENHHNFLYATVPEKAVAFESELLK